MARGKRSQSSLKEKSVIVKIQLSVFVSICVLTQMVRSGTWQNTRGLDDMLFCYVQNCAKIKKIMQMLCIAVGIQGFR